MMNTAKILLSKTAKAKDQKFMEKQKYHVLYNRWRDYEFLTTVFALIGLAMVMSNYELNVHVDEDPHDPEKYSDPMNDPRNLRMTTTLVRIMATVTTALACFCLIMRHKAKIEWLNNYFSKDDGTHIFLQYHELIAGADRDIREGSVSFYNS